MCPACLTTLALVATGAGSAGGLAAVIVRKIRKRPHAKELVATPPAEVPVKKEESR
jgi:hypothetical protein